MEAAHEVGKMSPPQAAYRASHSIQRTVETGLKKRRVQFFNRDDSTPSYYFRNNRALTCMLSAFSLTITVGEEFMISVVHSYLQRIDDPELRKQIKSFCTQESQHKRQHDLMNSAWALNNYDCEGSLKVLRRNVKILYLLPKRFQLALVVAFECIITTYSRLMLTNNKLRNDFDPKVLPLWCWHAIEEVEHKTVAFDVYKTVHNDYPVRIMALLFAPIDVFFNIYWVAMLLLHHDPMGLHWRDIRDILSFQFGRKGQYWQILRKYSVCFHPKYHPSQDDDTELLKKWRKQYVQYEVQ